MTDTDDRCFWCEEIIQIQIFKGSGFCSEEHRKLFDARSKQYGFNKYFSPDRREDAK